MILDTVISILWLPVRLLLRSLWTVMIEPLLVPFRLFEFWNRLIVTITKAVTLVISSFVTLNSIPMLVWSSPFPSFMVWFIQRYLNISKYLLT